MDRQIGLLKVYLEGDIVFSSGQRVGSGGFGDLYKGEHATDGFLALKRLRSHSRTDSDKVAPLIAIIGDS